MNDLHLPAIGPRDATMEFNVVGPKGIATIYSRCAAVAAKRRADIVSGRAPVPKLECNYCGMTTPKGALWCSTGCAGEYEAERQAVTGRSE